MDQLEYRTRVDAQLAQFRDVVNIHSSNPILEYWKHTYLRPRVNQVFQCNGHIEVYATTIAHRLEASDDCKRILSLGSGNGDLEVAIAKRLATLSTSEFLFECTDISPFVLERTNNHIRKAGLQNRFVLSECDLNQEIPAHEYIAVMAHHSLHHLVNLERLFDSIANQLTPGGVFVAFDMIGRNGHMRWPEALEIIERIWAFLPPQYRKNHVWQRVEESFPNRDYSVQGFEGIRAQDILPGLLERFYFERFLGYGNLTDAFVNRLYGPNYDPSLPFDRGLIDFLEFLNGLLMDLGHIKPTKMIAVMGLEPAECICLPGLTPSYCARPVV